MTGKAGEKAVIGSDAESAIKPVARRPRVLVIDDEPAVGRTIHRLLGERYEVTVLTGGSAALELFETGADFDLILCDLTMPDLGGIDVFRSASTRRPEFGQRFVFMTGGTFNPRDRDFLEHVPNDRIEKPFDLQTLRALVQHRVAQGRG